jgi:cyclopropane-fatty-acyl-phospholipid synthase
MSLFPLDRLLGRLVRHGRLTVVDAAGKRYAFGDAAAAPAVTVRLTDPRLPWKLALNPKLMVGEAYVDGTLVVEQGTLRDFLTIVLVSQSIATDPPRTPVMRKAERIYRTKDVINRLGRSERNVRHHYDIGEALYELFLDPDMQYSCGYWAEGVTSLEDAQTEKRRHIARKLLLRPGMQVLDIGCGWGGLALHLAREHGVRVTGVTLSQDQHAKATRRAAEAGLSDRVTFKLLDYRLEAAQYDRIVSVGMFEHVGRPQFAEFFDHVHRLLKPRGVALIHTIARMWDPGPINSWFSKYIFPGAYLPALSEVAPILERQGLWLTDLEILRLHYAKTLHAWNERFQSHRAEVRAMFDERFCRMWEFYLQSCEVSFTHQELCVFQLQLAKEIDAVPITRNYLYDDDRVAGARPAVATVRTGRPRVVPAHPASA